MVLIPVYNCTLSSSSSVPTTDVNSRETGSKLMGMFPVYTLFLSSSILTADANSREKGWRACFQYIFIFVLLVAAQLLSGCGVDPSMLLTSLGHCLDTLSNYGSGREPCADKVFSPSLGVLSGFVFQCSSPGDTTLSERGQTNSVP